MGKGFPKVSVWASSRGFRKFARAAIPSRYNMKVTAGAALGRSPTLIDAAATFFISLYICFLISVCKLYCKYNDTLNLNSVV